MKISELIGAQLDWAVAKCEKLSPALEYTTCTRRIYISADIEGDEDYSPATDWAQGGPIIEREKVAVSFNPDAKVWEANITNKEGNDFIVGYGPNPLIAAMRCYVASKLGGEIELPAELL